MPTTLINVTSNLFQIPYFFMVDCFLYFPVCKFQDKVSLEMVVDNGFQHSVKREIVTAWCQTGKWPVVNVSFKVNNLKF